MNRSTRNARRTLIALCTIGPLGMVITPPADSATTSKPVNQSTEAARGTRSAAVLGSEDPIDVSLATRRS